MSEQKGKFKGYIKKFNSEEKNKFKIDFLDKKHCTQEDNEVLSSVNHRKLF